MGETMKKVDRMSRAQLLELLTLKQQEIQELKGVSTTGPMKVEDVAGMSVESVIEMALSDKRTLTWQAANVVVNGQVGFFPSRIPSIIDAFEGTLLGSSALIVDAKGRHAAKVVDRHATWLNEHGFTSMPKGKKPKVRKEASQDDVLRAALKLLLQR